MLVRDWVITYQVHYTVVGVPSHACHAVSEGSAFSALVQAVCLTNTSPQAKHAEFDPCHGTPTMARFQSPEYDGKFNFERGPNTG